ncbi:MAG: hypothetical protein AB1489_34040, partial [Acidobacteriota bacterium]
LHLLHVKQYTLTEVSQSFVNVLVEAGEGESSRTLSGVATINPYPPAEAAARATLNALNRTLSPYLKANLSWQELIKRLIPIS